MTAAPCNVIHVACHFESSKVTKWGVLNMLKTGHV